MLWGAKECRTASPPNSMLRPTAYASAAAVLVRRVCTVSWLR